MRRFGRDRARRDDVGSAAVFVLGMSIVLLVCAGLVVDGGLAINARMRVADDAEQASRVAADSIDVDVLRSGGGIVIDEPVARQRAAAYLGDRGYSPGQFDVHFDGGSVRVRVSDISNTTILKLVKIDDYEVNARAVSTPETGP